MANFCLILAYDGTRYNGWQRQGNTPDTIQEKLENILEHLYGEPVEVHGSGRTDAGVHALRQVANYHVPRMLSRFSCQEIQTYFNQYLPRDIRVLSVSKADSRFHARLSAESKIYEYRIDCGPIADIFNRRYLYRIEEPLNLEKMQEAASYLVGTHDFKSFCANRHMKNGFLYHMVRILTGTLIEIGMGDLLPTQLPTIFESQNRELAGFTAPAQGLFLVEVHYPEAGE